MTPDDPEVRGLEKPPTGPPADQPADQPADRSADRPADDLAHHERVEEESSRRRRWQRGADHGAEAREREREERVVARIAAQWAQMREERRHDAASTPAVAGGASNFSQAQVPWGLDLAAAWGWRFLVICAAGYVILWLTAFFAVVTLPLAIALLIAALSSPVVSGLRRLGVPRGLAAIVVVVGLLGFIAMLLTFAGQQVASGANDLADSTVKGLDEIRDWLKDGPLHASDTQINSYIEQAQNTITERTRDNDWFAQATEIGSALGHVLAGFFIILFSTYFFLADGDRIWSWLVRLSPRAARERVDASGRVAWISLTQFVRATVIVAAVDAIGIMIGAAVLDVPFVLAIGVLVFLGAFVPMIGATIAGTVAVLVALVDQGPITALIMLAVVIGVQQIEGHILQPFLMGRWVSVHPLGVILAIAGGVLVAGIAGALVAVPLAAAVNAVVQHLASYTEPGSDPEEELAEDYEESRATSGVEEQA
ncbi:AI-2E family transporter [Nocardioides dongxiaopingii]|uniref:AI-2E family transporter n=1 Tax=Nocardioides dongxiaopingii TaxID=2576036 RepID=UPI001FECABF2|nr:AI-2E family transporter [Nocardioides dongxiaopingii]